MSKATLRNLLATTVLISGIACTSAHPGSPDQDAGVANNSDDAGTSTTTLPIRQRGTAGWPLQMTSDDTTAVVANRTADTVSIFHVDPAQSPPTLSRTANIPFPNSEPFTLIVGNDDDIAYVVLRKTRELRKIIHIRSEMPLLDAAVGKTGSEPSGIAISPSGRLIYVANWGDGTVSIFDSYTLQTRYTVDLNRLLVARGVLGNVASRPGLAHPFALVTSNNLRGHDEEETLFVTEFYSQQRPSGVPSDDSQFDVGREGYVYALHAHDGSPSGTSVIPIAPVADTGFKDSNGATTGCFPNQLYSGAIDNGKLYVTAVCASPRGPVGPVVTGTVTNTANFKTQVHAAVFTIDANTNKELPDQRVLLTQQFQSLYDAAGTPDNGANRRIPLIPNNIAFAPHSPHVAYVTAYGSDAVFRVHYKDDGSLSEVGMPSGPAFIRLFPNTMNAGRLPIGIAINRTGAFALVLNENTRNLSIVDLASQTVSGSVQSADPPAAGAAADANTGRLFFVTGLGRWSFKGEAWNSCEACHAFGLTDNVTWFFARGPRQTISLDGTFDKMDPTQQRVLNWSAIFDEIHDFENNTRGNSGGVGAIVSVVSTPPAAADRIIFDGSATLPGQVATAANESGLNGSTKSLMPEGSSSVKSAISDWDKIEAYVKTVRSPSGLKVPGDVVAQGRRVFEEGNCAGCHGTSMWTTSRVFYTPSELTNGAAGGTLKTATYTLPSGFPVGLNPPAAMAGNATLRFSGANAAANDQINCVLRSVGTFPATLDADFSGVVAQGVTVKETRQNMTTPAQGATGFNPPSLLNVIAGGPYLHAGNARTLEELFSPTFAAHYQALNPGFLAGADRDEKVKSLILYLLSIDGSSDPVPVPATLGFSPTLCPTVFP